MPKTKPYSDGMTPMNNEKDILLLPLWMIASLFCPRTSYMYDIIPLQSLTLQLNWKARLTFLPFYFFVAWTHPPKSSAESPKGSINSHTIKIFSLLPGILWNGLQGTKTPLFLKLPFFYASRGNRGGSSDWRSPQAVFSENNLCFSYIDLQCDLAHQKLQKCEFAKVMAQSHRTESSARLYEARVALPLRCSLVGIVSFKGLSLVQLYVGNTPRHWSSEKLY